MRVAVKLELSEEERTVLERYVRRGTTAQRLSMRAKIVLLCAKGQEKDFSLRVETPVKTLCPCSKEISDYGAHNQRGHVTIEVRTKQSKTGWEMVWIEDLVEVAEQSASAPIYALLKRSDERFVTMQAYDNPVFVEDLVRNVAVRLKKDARIVAFEVGAINQESIHAHNAFARVTWKRSRAKN